jgi:hypothetical protein
MRLSEELGHRSVFSDVTPLLDEEFRKAGLGLGLELLDESDQEPGKFVCNTILTKDHCAYGDPSLFLELPIQTQASTTLSHFNVRSKRKIRLTFQHNTSIYAVKHARLQNTNNVTFCIVWECYVRLSVV